MNVVTQPKNGFLCALMLLCIVLDQLTKYVASHYLSYASPVEVLPFLNWTLLHNDAVAFSFLSGLGEWKRWLFVVISSIASAAFFVWLLKTPIRQGLMRYSLAFIVAGAVGNLIDRVQLAYVVDFISVHWQNRYFFPAFNVADSFITIGAGLMVLDLFVQKETDSD